MVAILGKRARMGRVHKGRCDEGVCCVLFLSRPFGGCVESKKRYIVFHKSQRSAGYDSVVLISGPRTVD